MVAPDVLAQGVLARVGFVADVADVLTDVLVHGPLVAATEPVHGESGAAELAPEPGRPAPCGQGEGRSGSQRLRRPSAAAGSERERPRWRTGPALSCGRAYSGSELCLVRPQSWLIAGQRTHVAVPRERVTEWWRFGKHSISS